MKITDTEWNNIDLVKPGLNTHVIILFEENEYKTTIIDSDLENNEIICYLRTQNPTNSRIKSKWWRYYEDN